MSAVSGADDAEATRPESRTLTAALSYAAAGYPVFPCSGKVPLTKNGFKDATTSGAQIRAWWHDIPHNIGLPTGAVSGIIALDVDGPAGEASLATLEAEIGKLPITAEQQTPHGRHLVFQHPGGTKNSAGYLGDSLDVRGDGGYIVVAPSGGYKWRRSTVRLTSPPAAWARRIAAPLVVVPPENGGSNGATITIPEGKRNDALARLAGKYRNFGWDTKRIEAELQQDNQRCDPPLSAAEVAKIAGSIGSKPAGVGMVEAVVFAKSEDADAPAEKPFGALVESGQDFRAHAGDEPEMIIPGVLVSRGFAMVGGGAKEGKTWTLVDLMLAVANDVPFMDLAVATPGRVLYIPAEGSRAGTAARFDMLARGKGLDPDRAMRHVDLLFRKNVMLDDPAFQAYLAEVADRYVVIVADPLIKLWNGDEDKAKDVGPFTRQLTEIAERGPAFVLSHHTVKVSETSRDRNPWLNIRGSGQWYGALDSGLYVERGKGATRTTVKFAGKDYSPVPDATFTWPAFQVRATDPVSLDWQRAGESSTGIEQQEREAVVIATQHPGISGRQLRDQLPGAVATRQQALWNVLNRGELVKQETTAERSDHRSHTYEGLYIPGADTEPVAGTNGTVPTTYPPRII